jgi:hypothetical protein
LSGGVDLQGGRVTMQNRIALSAAVLATLVVAAVAALATAQPSGAFIHEMIGAGCRFGGEDVEPPGQTPGPPGGNAQSTIRALQATGVISSIEITATQQIVHFDLSRPNAKFVSAGFNLTIPGGGVGGRDLVLAPLPTIVGSTFPAFVHCANLRPA